MEIEIWSDFACPFCYIGEIKLKKALSELSLDEKVNIKYKSFQLNVNAKRQVGKDINELIANKYGITYDMAKQSNLNIINIAKDVGLKFNFNIIKPGNTQLAHELYKYSEKIGKQLEMAEILFSAYFVNGIDISNKEDLIKLSCSAGIEKEVFNKIINNNEFTKEVLEDQDYAIKHSINSVPFFVVDNKITISGAQSVEYFKKVLEEFK